MSFNQSREEVNGTCAINYYSRRRQYLMQRLKDKREELENDNMGFAFVHFDTME
jgi:hypothetical protein